MIETEAHTMMGLICSQVVKTVKRGLLRSNIFVVISTHLYKIGRQVKKDLCRKFKETFTTADMLHVHFH